MRKPFRKILDALSFALQAIGVIVIASLLAIPALLEKALERRSSRGKVEDYSSREM